ncbi:MAG: hypothetical protein QOI51_1588 [Nocardioidaceae bacterium]|jgi:hypothetical protein|nr:hypothetical protein [Nocardioidaceae bacterium]
MSERTAMTDRDDTKGHGDDNTLELTVRTPAGHPFEFCFKDDTRVSKAAREATDHFVHVGLLEAGAYGLALIRGGRIDELADGARLDDFNIVDGDILALYPKKPQVDGQLPVAA